jgi:ferredoxin-NADP reductase
VEIQHIPTRVASRVVVATDVIQLDLEPSGGRLPEWTPGSHVDIVLADGEARQYSLSGSPDAADRWTLGILVEREGRGGSLWISENATPGSSLTVSVPRNHFEFRPQRDRVVFIAGGIGITALLPMIERAQADGRDWELHYVGRSLAHMAFLDRLSVYGSLVTLYPRDSSDRPDVERIVLGRGPVDVYCCGPEALMEAVEEVARANSEVEAHVERFEPRPIEADSAFDEFDVVFEYSGLEAHVGPGQTILEAAETVGIEVPTSCREGTCGTCETPVIAGTIAHRDSILSDAEREASATMMICISRASCPRLVLDL